MKDAATTLLEHIDRICGTPGYLFTKGIQADFNRNGLGPWLSSLEDQGRALLRPVSHSTANKERQRLDKKHRLMPGLNDIGLLLVARDHGAPLVTDDYALYQLGLAEGVRCLDLFDLSLAAIAAGSLTRSQVEALFGYLTNPSPHFHPLGWKSLSQRGVVWPAGLDELRATRRSDQALRDALGI